MIRLRIRHWKEWRAAVAVIGTGTIFVGFGSVDDDKNGSICLLRLALAHVGGFPPVSLLTVWKMPTKEK